MGEMLYDVLVYPYQFSSKEHAQKSVGIIKNNILRFPQSMTIKEIAKASVSGHVMAFCHAEKTGIKNSFSQDCWQYQKVYALDFDNTYTVDVGGKKEKRKLEAPYYMTWREALAHAQKQGFSPAFIYTSSSHTEDWQRFRMVFALNTEAISILEHEKIEKALLMLFSINGKTVADKSCIDRSRIFYPGKELVYENYDAVTDLSKLLEKYPYEKAHHIPTVGEEEPNHTVEEEESVKEQSERIQQLIIELQEHQTARRIASKSLRDRIALRLRGNEPTLKKNNNKNNIILFPDSQILATPRAMRDCEDFDAFCYQINLAELLDLPENEEFNCILPGHDDDNASASIVWHNDRYKYRCFGCDSTYDIFGLLERLSGCSRPAVMDWICDTYNIRYESEWQRMQKENIQLYHDYLVMNLKKDFPYLYRQLVRANETGVLLMFLDIARIHLLDRAWAGMNKPAFFYSLSSFCKMNEFYGLRKNQITLYKNLVHLARLGLIEILDDEQIPPSMKNYLESKRIVNKQVYRSNCYAVPPLTADLLENAQNAIREDQRLGMRRTYLCREQCVRGDGKDAADKIYVQNKDKESNPEVDTFYNRYKGACERLLEKKGWTTEEEIINRVKGYSKQQKTKYSGFCLPQLLQELELERVGFSKALEERFAIKTRKRMRYGANKIIIRRQ